MNYLFRPTLKNIVRRKEVRLYWLFSLFPLLLIVVDLFNTNFMQLSAPESSLSFFDFFSAVVVTQHQLTLPLILLTYLISQVFYYEIQSGKLFLYKDIDRDLIVSAKISSLAVVYLLYMFFLFLSSLMTYYSYLIRLGYTSKTFFSNSMTDNLDACINILGIMFVVILLIVIAAILSLYFSSGVTILCSVLFIFTSTIAPDLKLMRYIFPSSYSVISEEIGWGNALLIMIGLFITYLYTSVVIVKRLFKKIDY